MINPRWLAIRRILRQWGRSVDKIIFIAGLFFCTIAFASDPYRDLPVIFHPSDPFTKLTHLNAVIVVGDDVHLTWTSVRSGVHFVYRGDLKDDGPDLTSMKVIGKSSHGNFDDPTAHDGKSYFYLVD